MDQQRVLKRVKRGRTIIHDKQKELPIHTYQDKTVFQRVLDDPDPEVDPDDRTSKNSIPVARWTNQMQFNDPFYRDQWYYVSFYLFRLIIIMNGIQDNKGQTGGSPGIDLNVIPVWKKGLTGKGVVVSILDDGIDHTHPDLRDNYVS